MEVISKAFFCIIMTLDRRGSIKKPISRTCTYQQSQQQNCVICFVSSSVFCWPVEVQGSNRDPFSLEGLSCNSGGYRRPTSDVYIYHMIGTFLVTG